MIIPPERISGEALNALLEEYITRDGTDYGETELSLEDKIRRLKPQVSRGEVLIVFDETTESINLIHKNDYQP